MLRLSRQRHAHTGMPCPLLHPRPLGVLLLDPGTEACTHRTTHSDILICPFRCTPGSRSLPDAIPCHSNTLHGCPLAANSAQPPLAQWSWGPPGRGSAAAATARVGRAAPPPGPRHLPPPPPLLLAVPLLPARCPPSSSTSSPCCGCHCWRSWARSRASRAGRAWSRAARNWRSNTSRSKSQKLWPLLGECSTVVLQAAAAGKAGAGVQSRPQ